MAASMQNSKKKLLNDLAAEEAKREDAVRQLQQMKEEEQKILITSLSSGKFLEDIAIPVELNFEFSYMFLSVPAS